MKNLFLVSLFALLCISTWAHDEDPYHPGSIKNRIDSLEISFIDLRTNPFLYRVVKKFIQERADSSALFRGGYGFVTIDRIRLSPPGPIPIQQLDTYARDVTATFTLTTSSYPLSDRSSLTRYPSHYSLVDGRVVLVYNELLEWTTRPLYTHASRTRVEKLVLDCLQMALLPDFVIYDPFKGESYKLSEEQRGKMSQREILEMASFTVSSNKTVIQNFDGSVVYSK
ncbi:hypothetical protein [Telluribacter sp. SYSU D00476]|uniref:hypothetical protein n=1 Tax=Telluribacter sp. SYSU D00476 TaxID=2811430 RepID=UPI001FF0F9D5|nr:hypothetical protein [Telluribacter sp. SYSU D00476]